MSPNNQKFQKGVALYFAISILSVLTAVLLALVSISVSQIKVIGHLGDSVVAFYAADSGIEEMLKDRASPNMEGYSGYLDLNENGTSDNGDSFYEVTVVPSGAECSAQNYCVRSIGTYQGIKRAIEIKY
ncbi:MAG: hypothetical protein DRH33_02370 [Candidatus Nealsonbacteria bacterium]|nr:MAG: hypothetical protein DRH33_02370 [Candidatus Nealsonbacteria bacterium]